jgi:hypothetical protein
MGVEIFIVPEGGEIVLRYPRHLTEATFADFEEWTKLVVNKMRRWVQHETEAARSKG